jgi:hypothetical protein
MLKTINYLVPVVGVLLVGYGVFTHQTRKFPNLVQPQNQNTEFWQVIRVSDGDIDHS